MYLKTYSYFKNFYQNKIIKSNESLIISSHLNISGSQSPNQENDIFNDLIDETISQKISLQWLTVTMLTTREDPLKF